MTQKRKPGRKPLAPAARKSVIIATAVTTDESAAIEHAASLEGQTRADFMRRVLIQAAAAQLQPATLEKRAKK